LNKIKWSQEGGISLKTHLNYVESFAQTFFQQVKNLIDKNQQNNISELFNLNKADLTLGLEVLDHAYFCIETALKFHGRNDLLSQVIRQFELNLLYNLSIFFKFYSKR
jgi:hypothetical protein